MPKQCPKCGSDEIDEEIDIDGVSLLYCRSCDHEWEDY